MRHDITHYHGTLGIEIQKLVSSYRELYDITDVYYSIEDQGDRLKVTIGIAPIHLTKKIDTFTYIQKDIEDEVDARAYIPRIHAAFIKKLYTEARHTLYTVSNSD